MRHKRRHQAGPLAARDLALQREDPLGARAQAHRPRPPLLAAGDAHAGRPRAHPRRPPTLPILELDGRAIVDSTAIIAALEERYPEPPLYPSDPEQRRRALELEDFFDEQLGPHVRLLAFNELIADPAVLRETGLARPSPDRWEDAKPWSAPTPAPTPASASAPTTTRRAAAAKAKVLTALDRLDAELESGGGEFLVGDELSVADITAASLFYPLVAPEGSPVAAPTRPPPA